MKHNEKFNLQQLLSDCKGLIDELSRKVSVMERIVNESSVTEDECKKGDCENDR